MRVLPQSTVQDASNLLANGLQATSDGDTEVIARMKPYWFSMRYRRRFLLAQTRQS